MAADGDVPTDAKGAMTLERYPFRTSAGRVLRHLQQLLHHGSQPPPPRRPRDPQNPLGVAFWLVLVIFALGLAACTAALLHPGSSGRSLEAYVGEDVYSCPRLEINRPFLRLTVDQGLLAPVYSQGHVIGAVISGRGTAMFIPPGPERARIEREIGQRTIEDQFNSVFILGSYQEVETLRYSATATKASNPGFRAAAERHLRSAQAEMGQRLPFNITRLFFFRPTTFSCHLSTDSFGKLRYIEGEEVELTFIDLGHRRVSFANTQPRPALTEPTSVLTRQALPLPTAAIFGSTVLFLFLLIYLFTLDLNTDHIRARHGRFHRADAAFFVALLLCDVAFGLLQRRFLLEESTTTIVYGGFGLLILWYGWRRRWGFASLGLTGRHLGRSLALALLLPVLGTAGLTLAWPRGLALTDLTALAQLFAWSLGTTGLLAGLYRQGFILTMVQRAVGPRTGLAVAGVLAGFIHLLPAALLGMGRLPHVYLESLIAVPLSALLFGFMYYRTGNLWGVALARALFELLPRLLQF